MNAPRLLDLRAGHHALERHLVEMIEDWSGTDDPPELLARSVLRTFGVPVGAPTRPTLESTQ